MVTSADYPADYPPSATPSNRSPLSLLTIAGHDPSSGAGITADLEVFAAHGFFGLSAPTALTVQSTQGVVDFQPVDPHLLRQILDHLTADISPAGIKIGMLGSLEVAESIAIFLQQQHSQSPGNRHIPLIFDPVIISSSGRELLAPEARSVLHDRFLPHVTWITPNWHELAALTASAPIQTLTAATAATHQLAQRHPHLHIVATAGDASQPTDLLRLPTGEIHHFEGHHIESRNTHGTGCAFSSALLCNLAQGHSAAESVANAKHYVTQAILHAPNIGHGKGPLNLLWPLTTKPGGPSSSRTK
ncbi:MAG: bifunctional hydroxymethylpyrimidine kinase/phosphomethylpyrimidine kinase [Acidobacteriota bacterium]